MDDAGKASVAHVEACLGAEFVHIFGAKGDPPIEPTHILNSVDWYESEDKDEVYASLVIEPILDIPNNLVCLCPPFNIKKYK
jgi:hypothetical protein